MKKKCPKCQRYYSKDYDECIICKVLLISDKEQPYKTTTEGKKMMGRAAIVSPIVKVDSGYEKQNNTNEDVVENESNYTHQDNNNLQDNRNLIVNVLRGIGIITTNIITMILDIGKSLVNGGNSINCRGIIVNSISIETELYGKIIRFLRGMVTGRPYSIDGKFAIFQICELDSAGRPIRNKAYNIRMYGNVSSGQLLSNNEIEVSGYKDNSGEIISNHVININSGITVKATGCINMIAFRNIAILAILLIIIISTLKMPGAQNNTTILDNLLSSIGSGITAFLIQIINMIVILFIKILEITLPLFICIFGLSKMFKRKK